MTLSKIELIAALNEQIGLNKAEANDMVDTFFEEIRTTLEGNESVKLTGFGNFRLLDKKPRRGFNPKTGEEHSIKARRVVTFHPSPLLKDLITKNYQG